MTGYKCIIIGPSGVGKTTLKRLWFGQENPLLLFNTSIDPTIGKDFSIYQLGPTIAVHDYAGQQLNEWFESAQDHFQETDLIFLITDIRADPNTNIKLLSQLHKFREKYCVRSKIVMFLHKIDLLSPEELSRRISAYFISIQPKYALSIFFTSISPDFYIGTLKIFLTILQDFMLPSYSKEYDDLILKCEILFQISQTYGHSTIEKLAILLNKPRDILIPYLIEMSNRGQLSYNPELNIIELTLKGTNKVSQFKRNLDKILHPLAPRRKKQTKMIKGICPYCHNSFITKSSKKLSEYLGGIMQTLIKPHTSCQEFVVFLDRQGNIRGNRFLDGMNDL